MITWRQLSAVTLLWQARAAVKKNDAARVLRSAEAKAGVRDDDYTVPDRLRGKIASYLDGMPSLLTWAYVTALAGALGMHRRSLDALHVLEAFLGIEPDDYADTARLWDKIRRRSEGLPRSYAVMLIPSVADVLAVLGRDSEGVALLRADLGLDPPGGNQDQAAIRSSLELKLSERLAGAAPEAAAMYLLSVVSYLDRFGVHEHKASVLENYLGLLPGDYQSGQLLSARLGPFSTVTGMAQMTLVISLAMLLKESGVRERAIALVEWHIGISPVDYRDAGELGRKWQLFRDRTNPDVGTTIWRVLADLLADTDRPDDLIAVFEADTGVRLAELGSSETFGRKLARRFDGLQVDTSAAYIVSLAYDLEQLGYAEQAGMVTDWYLRGYDNLWQVPGDGDPGATHVIPLVALWLKRRGHADPDFAWALADQTVTYLRRSLLIENLRLDDRREFIGYIEDLRGEIKRVGYAWDEPGDRSPQARARVLTAQLWDAELGQRALFEEFLLADAQPVAPGSPPEDRWPYATAEPVNEGPPTFAGLSPEQLARLLAQDIALPDDPVAPVSTPGGSPAIEDWLTDAEQIVRDGVSADVLAAALAPGTVLVRAGFRPADGALAWAALRITDDRHVDVVDWRAGQANDQRRARLASLRHDLGLQMATATAAEAAGSDSAGDRLAIVLISAAEQIVAALNEAALNEAALNEAALNGEALNEAALNGAAAGRGADGRWQQALAGQFAVLDSPASSLARSARLGTQLAGLLSPAGELSRAWLNFALIQIGYLRGTAERHLVLASQPDGMSAEIDEVTRAYLGEIAGIWPLGSLAEHLDTGTDLVFQLEDALQQVPIAHYPMPGDVPLYALTRSTRVSLSMLVTIMQERLERRFATPDRRILALSYFDPGDRSGEIVPLLHYAHRWLASESADGKLICLNAAETPLGSIAALQAALTTGGGFQAVTICGHGIDRQDTPDEARSGARSGIRLADGLWRGAGCDLRSVNFLLLPSCSMGRLRQPGDSDVSGMCAVLALNRARSVLACRWPVITDQAIAFAHEVVAIYLELSAEPGAGYKDSMRARAVNIARHRFLGSTGQPPNSRAILLHTVAAFELFGLG